MSKLKNGFAPIIVFLLLLLVASGIVFYVTRDQKRAKAATPNNPNPVGIIHANPDKTYNNGGSVNLTATDVVGANGAQVESVRYFLLNPTLATGNNWGNPDWCSSGSPCTQSTVGGLITYDIAESSNPGNNYLIVWDKNTHSSASTPYSRALNQTNIPAGTYTVGLRIQDVNGNVTGNATSATVTVLSGVAPTPTPNLGLGFSVSSINLRIAAGGMGKKAFDLTSTGATKYWLYTPTNSMGVLFSPSEGNIAIGQSIPTYVFAGPGQPAGTYSGTVYASSSNTNAQTSTGITDTIIIDPPTADTDSDGFSNDRENKMGTDPNYACKTPTGVNAWPPDVNNDGQVNSIDQNVIASVFGARTGDSKYNKRFDLNADGVINVLDLQKDATYNGKSCS